MAQSLHCFDEDLYSCTDQLVAFGQVVLDAGFDCPVVRLDYLSGDVFAVLAKNGLVASGVLVGVDLSDLNSTVIHQPIELSESLRETGRGAQDFDPLQVLRPDRSAVDEEGLLGLIRDDDFIKETRKGQVGLEKGPCVTVGLGPDGEAIGSPLVHKHSRVGGAVARRMLPQPPQSTGVISFSPCRNEARPIGGARTAEATVPPETLNACPSRPLAPRVA